VVLLEERGMLKGLVTVKDVLKYTAHIENADNSPTLSSNGASYTGECGGILDRISSWLTRREARRQPYSQLRNRSSLELSSGYEESHELDGR
jgi:chloride channel 3/4/5